MYLTVLGSSGTYPAPSRPASGYLIEHKATRVWCDAGPGTFLSLPIDTDLISAIVISHSHLDHCLDLLAAYASFRFGPHPREEIRVLCPQDVVDRLLAFLGDGDSHPIHRTFRFESISDQSKTNIGDLEVQFTSTEHSVPTVASRWEGSGRVMAYSADTGPDGGWHGIAEAADLFVCEATFQGTEEGPGHLTAGQAGAIARRVGAHSLMLTHIPPHLDPTRSVSDAEHVFDRPVALAVPGLRRKV